MIELNLLSDFDLLLLIYHKVYTCNDNEREEYSNDYDQVQVQDFWGPLLKQQRFSARS